MFIKRWGNGPRVFVGFHGWSGSHKTYAPIVRGMPADVSFYSVDLPGYGQTPAPERWDTEYMARLVMDGLSSIDAPTVTLIGNCSGAILGILAAELNPKRFERLILIDPFAYVPWFIAPFLVPGIGRSLYNLIFTNPIGRWFTNTAMKGRRTGNTDLTASFSTVNHAVTYRYLQLIAEQKNPHRLSHFEMPIDIIAGEKTFGAITKSIAIWQDVWPEAKVWRLAGAAHLPLQEATAKMREILFST